MKKITLLSILFVLSLHLFANEDMILQVLTEGYSVTVIEFEDGDVIKLFDVASGDHILSKTHNYIDLSQLPSGEYLLENSKGQSTIIQRLELDLFVIEERVLGTDYVVTDTIEHDENNGDTSEVEMASLLSSSDPLKITRVGSTITVNDFHEGDKIKLFEIKNTVHILTKTTNKIDLSQIAPGKYFIENSTNGRIAIVSKVKEEPTEEYNDMATVDMD